MVKSVTTSLNMYDINFEKIDRSPPPYALQRTYAGAVSTIGHSDRNNYQKSIKNMAIPPAEFEMYNGQLRQKSYFRERLTEFLDSTTIQGVGQMGRSDLPTIIRIIWSMAFLSCLGVTLVLVGQSLFRYLTFDVQTTTAFQTTKDVKFPAVTICSENMLQRSLVGRSPQVLDSVSALLFGDMQHSANASSARRSCYLEGDINDTDSEELNTDAYSYFRRIGINAAMHKFAMDSFKSVAKCWWKDEVVNCSNKFLNHITDYGLCFTLNPGTAILRDFKLGMEPADTGYGIEKSYRPYTLRSTGPNNGFRVLLNAHQDEYCWSTSHSAGFRAVIHDADVQPLFFLDVPLLFSPGYESSVAIRFTRLTKNTQQLGRCVKDMPLELYPEASSYHQKACYMDCFTTYVFDKCHCTPLYGPPKSNHIKIAKFGISYVPICWEQSLLFCMKEQERTFLAGRLDQLCKKCIESCDYYHYDFQVTTSYFPADNFVLHYDSYLSPIQTSNGSDSSVTRLHRNLLLINFYIESLHIHVITEEQAMNIESLVGDIGGHVGFFLGMSIMSVLELGLCLLPKQSDDEDHAD